MTILHNATHTLQRHWTLTAKIAISAVCYTGVLVARQTVMPTVAVRGCDYCCSLPLLFNSVFFSSSEQIKKSFCRMNFSLVTAFSADVLIFQTRPSFCRPDCLSVTMSLCPSLFCYGRRGPKPSNTL